jgi:hypothetical protein
MNTAPLSKAIQFGCILASHFNDVNHESVFFSFFVGTGKSDKSGRVFLSSFTE